MYSSRFKWCVVGNIVKTHVDAEGTMRYGTTAYAGGAKVFLCGKSWWVDDQEIRVIGLTRGKKFQVHDVPVSLIENVRAGRTYTPEILEIMDNFEFWEEWWDDSWGDHKATEAFVSVWNRKDELNRLENCFEIRKFDSEYIDPDLWYFWPKHIWLTYDSKRNLFLDSDTGKEYDIVEQLCYDRVMVRLREQ